MKLIEVLAVSDNHIRFKAEAPDGSPSYISVGTSFPLEHKQYEHFPWTQGQALWDQAGNLLVRA